MFRRKSWSRLRRLSHLRRLPAYLYAYTYYAFWTLSVLPMGLSEGSGYAAASEDYDVSRFEATPMVKEQLDLARKRRDRLVDEVKDRGFVSPSRDVAHSYSKRHRLRISRSYLVSQFATTVRARPTP